MASPKKISQPVIPRKRPFYDAKNPPPKIRTGVQVFRDFPPGCGTREDSLGSKADVSKYPPSTIRTGVQVFRDFPLGCGTREDSLGSKADVSKYPPSKIRTALRVVRDFPPGCGTKEDSIGSKAERNLFKNSDNVGSELGKLTSHDRGKLVTSQSLKNNKPKALKPKELGVYKPSFGSRPAGKVKFWDPNCSKDNNNTQKSEDTTKEKVRREKIKEAIVMFDEVYHRLYLENKSKTKGEKIAHWRVPMEAAKIVKRKMKWMDAEKILGPICGVQVGDRFNYRSQLHMVGLHCQPQSGIDYTSIGGQNLAISIVDSNRYNNERESCNVLYYSGQGGVSFLGSKQPLPEDQKLQRGNLALRNSMNVKNPVRVIRKLHALGHEAFVYDGLYIVENYINKKGEGGKMVFMFQLNRVPGQPELHKALNANK